MLVAHELGKFEDEVAEHLDTGDLARWLAMFRIWREQEQRANKRAERVRTSRTGR